MHGPLNVKFNKSKYGNFKFKDDNIKSNFESLKTGKV